MPVAVKLFLWQDEFQKRNGNEPAKKHAPVGGRRRRGQRGGGNLARGRVGGFSDRDGLRAWRRRNRRRAPWRAFTAPRAARASTRSSPMSPMWRWRGGKGASTTAPKNWPRPSGRGRSRWCCLWPKQRKPAIWRAPASIPSACACRPTRSPKNCWRRRGGRSPRLRPICPAMSARRRRRMCWPISTAASTPCSMAAPVRSAWNRPLSRCLTTRRACCGRAAFRDRRWSRFWAASLRAIKATAQNPWRRACSPPTMRRAQNLRLDAQNLREGEAGLDFGGQISWRGKIRPFAEQKSRRGGGQSFHLFARARSGRRGKYRRGADSRGRSRRGDQRPPAPRRRAERMIFARLRLVAN